MKDNLLVPLGAMLGVLGSAILSLYGGWDSALATLTTFMAIDYITGFLVAAVFKRSTKSETGTLVSNAGFKGFVKKGVILLMVLVACQLDRFMNSNYVRDAVIIGFILNESVSIVENCGLMGVPIPNAIKRTIEILRNKDDEEDDEEEDE